MTRVARAATRASGARPAAASAGWIRAVAESPAFAWGTLLLLQLRAVFGMWTYRDLPFGDTAGYFGTAAAWHARGDVDPLWSPLYTVLWGSLMRLSEDPFTVTLLHRLLVVFAVTALFHAFLRRVLPTWFAWGAAAWWAILPVGHDALYEVHLFAAIPILLALLVAFGPPGRPRRGAVLGIFLGSTLLVRNETLLATAFWAAFCLAAEVREARAGRAASGRVLLRAYGIPVAIPVVALAFAISRDPKWPQARARLREKHTLNVCQIYAYGYQQRHADWTKSPWTECRDLMSRDFATPEPTMGEALRRNPRAMLEHVLWNVRLVPDGLQVTLWGRSAGRGQPDYLERPTRSRLALALDLLALGLLAAGGTLVWADRRGRWGARLRQRLPGLVAMGAVLTVMAVVMVTQRPRPSYLFGLFFCVASAVGASAAASTERLGLQRAAARAGPWAALLLVAALPRYYGPGYVNPAGGGGQPLRALVERVLPYRAAFRVAERRVVTFGYGLEICGYVGAGACRARDFRDVIAGRPPDLTLGTWFSRENVGLLYADENTFAEPRAGYFLAYPETDGWEAIVRVERAGERWGLYRPRPEAAGKEPAPL